MQELKTLQPKTSEERAYDELRSLILSGELPHNKFLSQRMLAKRTGVAVVTIRGAIRRLENEGLLENIPRWGTRIPIETPDMLRERYFMREVLEVAAVQQFLQNPTPEQCHMMRELALLCDDVAHEDPENIERFSEQHFGLHHYITECSGSRLLVEAVDRLSMRTLMLWNAKRGWARGQDRESHVHLVDEILSGDPARATAAMRNHVRRGLEHELRTLNE